MPKRRLGVKLGSSSHPPLETLWSGERKRETGLCGWRLAPTGLGALDGGRGSLCPRLWPSSSTPPCPPPAWRQEVPAGDFALWASGRGEEPRTAGRRRYAQRLVASQRGKAVRASSTVFDVTTFVTFLWPKSLQGTAKHVGWERMGVGGTQKGLWLHRRTAGSSQGSVQQVREEVSRILPGRRRQWPRGDSWGGAGPTSLTRVSLSVALRPRWQVTAPPSSSPAFLLPAALPSLRDDCGLGLAMNAERIFLQLMPFRRLWPLLCKINAKTH